MKIDRGLVLALGAAAVTSACAAGGGAAGPRVSVPPPDVVCSTGLLAAFPVADSAAATLALMGTVADEARPAEYAAALEQSRRAVAAQPENAYGYFLGAQAALGVNDFAEAERMIAGAVERCPELDAEVSDYRAVGANQAFERAGSLLTAAGDTAGAVAAYEASLRLYPENYPADFYLGLIAFQQQRTDDAVRHWRQVMEVIDGLPAVDEETTADRASARSNAQNALIFAARQYLEREQVEPAIALLTEIRRAAPNNSEAAYYHALALNTQQRWAELLPVARQATELAPLSYGAWILYYNAFAGQSQAATQAGNPTQGIELARQAREVSERSENLAIQIEGVSVDHGDAGTTVRGTAVGTGRTAPVRLEFTLHGPTGPVGTGIVTVTPPAADAQSPFEVAIETTGPVTGVSYRVLGS